MQEGDRRKGGPERWEKWMEKRTIDIHSTGNRDQLGDFIDNLARKLNEPIA